MTSFEACAELVALLSHPLTLFKFLRMAHLLNPGPAMEDDTTAPTSSAFSALRFTPAGQIVITEKIDGANLGICLDSLGRILIQNCVNSKPHIQLKEPTIWVRKRREVLKGILGVDCSSLEWYVLFGEWMVCVHCIKYTRLPDRFLALDLYTGRGRCWHRGTSSKLSWRDKDRNCTHLHAYSRTNGGGCGCHYAD